MSIMSIMSIMSRKATQGKLRQGKGRVESMSSSIKNKTKKV